MTEQQSFVSAYRPWLLLAGLVLGIGGGLFLARMTGNVWLQVIMLGIVEGITEFLPISSTAHLLITTDLIGFEYSNDGRFEIFIQLGAVIAVVWFYAQDLFRQVRGVGHDPAIRRFWIAIIVAFLPAAVLGFLLRGWIKEVLFSANSVIAWTLIIGGIIFIVVEWIPPRQTTTTDITQISLWQALAIGCVQVLALIPGTSRSGASILGGMFAGLNRSTATAFSFYLAIPTLGGATLYEMLDAWEHLDANELQILLLGMVISGVVAWLSIGWLLRYVSKNNFVPFGIYRIVVGLVILGLIAIGEL